MRERDSKCVLSEDEISAVISALTLLVWHQEEHLVSKELTDEMLALLEWLSVWSKVQM